MIVPVKDAKIKTSRDVPKGTHSAKVLRNKGISKKGSESLLGVLVYFEIAYKGGSGVLSKKFKPDMASGTPLRNMAESLNGGKWNVKDDLDILNGKPCKVDVVIDDQNPGGAIRPRIETVSEA